MSLEILVLILSLLSISWGATAFKAMYDSEGGKPFTTLDYILEMAWNILAISCRVITLALFASQYRYWFAGVVVVQCVLWIGAIMCIEREEISDCSGNIMRITLGIGCTFNVILVGGQKSWYVFYSIYWFVTMIQNAILIYIWIAATADTQLWYRMPAIIYVFVAYFVSFIIKIIHTNIRKDNQYKALQQ